MTQVEIVNLALRHIAQAPIILMSDGSEQATVANDVYIPCLQECLRGNNWSFASAIDALVLSVNYTPPSGFSFAYNYPTAAMAVWKVSNSYSNPSDKRGYDFREVYDSTNTQKIIITNCKDALVEYTYYVTTTALFDASFVNMFSYRLAAAMAMPLNADPDQAINMTKIFQNQMSEAQRQSSYENQICNGESPDVFVNSREGGPGVSNSVSIGGETFDQWNKGN